MQLKTCLLFEGTVSQKKTVSQMISDMGRHGEMGKNKGMTVSSLGDFGAGKNQYLSSHLFKGDTASISSLWTMELEFSFNGKG